MIPLSVLDLSVVTTGTKPAAALRNSIDLARHVDGLGYVRYWLAEHHNLASVASPAPDVMIGQIAAVTKHIRVGSGGVMLPNHAPLVVAERFKMLEALFPGRIDLGLGRAPGTDGATAYALRSRLDRREGDDFLERLHELILWETREFPAGHPYNNVVAMPDDYAAAADLAARLQRLSVRNSQRKSAWASRSRIILRPMTRSTRWCNYRSRFQPSAWRADAARDPGGRRRRRRNRCGGRKAGLLDGPQPPAPRPRAVSAAAERRGSAGLSLYGCRTRLDRAQPLAAVRRQPGDA